MTDIDCFSHTHNMDLSPETPIESRSRGNSPTTQKKVDFDLSVVGVQDFYEYRRKIKWGKYPKPFDPLKKPAQSVLKDSTPSPISPFYKRAWNINYWTPTVTTDQLIQQSMLETEDEDAKLDLFP